MEVKVDAPMTNAGQLGLARLSPARVLDDLICMITSLQRQVQISYIIDRHGHHFPTSHQTLEVICVIISRI
jgi:hypothetical protein